MSGAWKTVLITGAAQGLGLTTARLLAHGALDGLVNNAGISLIVAAEETSAAQWQRVMAINLFGPFLLAAEWGGRGVRVNAVCPGWIKTEMDAADQGAGADRSGFINGVRLPVDGGWLADASWDSLRRRTRG